MKFLSQELESILRHVNFPVEFAMWCSTLCEGKKVRNSHQKEVQNSWHPASSTGSFVLPWCYAETQLCVAWR